MKKAYHERRMKLIKEYVEDAEEFREKTCNKECSECELDCHVPTLKNLYDKLY